MGIPTARAAGLEVPAPAVKDLQEARATTEVLGMVVVVVVLVVQVLAHKALAQDNSILVKAGQGILRIFQVHSPIILQEVVDAGKAQILAVLAAVMVGVLREVAIVRHRRHHREAMATVAAEHEII